LKLVETWDELEGDGIGPAKRGVHTENKKNKEEKGGKSFATTELELMENDSPQTLHEERK
jgi:hypothetical protein